MAQTKVFLLALLLVCVAGFVIPAYAQRHFSLCYSQATLLSGGLTDCANVSSSSCRRGVASAMALVRGIQATGRDVFFLPFLDRQSPFAQMHPDTWGVNAKVFDYMGIPNYIIPQSLFSSGLRNMSVLQSAQTIAKPFISNTLISPVNDWYGLPQRTVVSNGVGLVCIVSENEPNSAPGVASAASALRFLGQLAPAVHTRVVLLEDERFNPILFTAALNAILEPKDRPTVVLHLAEDVDVTMVNGTWTAGFPGTSGSRMTVVDFNFTTGNVLSTLTSREESLTLTNAQKDARWYADQVFLRAEALRATTNDPRVGHSTTMAPGRNTDGSLRYCVEGECSLGNLFTSAVRWKFDSDIGLTSSGGLRGPGWAAGEVKISDLWGALPFANTLCKTTISGLSLFEMLNYSMSLAQFTNVKTATGDRLVQTAGLRVRVNPTLSPSKLLSVEVLDRTTQAYLPLDRLKLYTVAMDSFICHAFDPFPTFWAAKYTGETGVTTSDALFQNIVAEYLTATTTSSTPFNASYQGRLVKDSTSSSAAVFMDWIETQTSCQGDTYWSPGVASCLPCPAGEYQPVPGGLTCDTIKADNTGLVVGIVVPIVVLLIGGIVAVMINNQLIKRKSVRNVSNAPQSGEITIMFTDIQDSTKLWGAAPASMAVSLEMHHAMIREQIAKHSAYEVKTVGDSFMIVVSSVEAGVCLARDIQLSFQQVQFPRAISDIYASEGEDALDAVVDDPNDLAPLDPLWNGVRVRIGVHVGHPDVQFDDIAKGYDYYGSPVNVAARVESVGKGGQIVCSNAVQHALTDPSSLQLTISSIGVAELKGVAEPMELFQLSIDGLTGRAFAKLEEGANYDDEDGASSVGSEASAAVGLAMQYVGPFTKFLAAVLKLFPQKDAEKTIDLMCKHWRVSGRKTKAEADLFEAIVRRIIPSMRKDLEETTLVRRASFAPSSGGGSNHGSLRLEKSGRPKSMRNDTTDGPLTSESLTQDGAFGTPVVEGEPTDDPQRVP